MYPSRNAGGFKRSRYRKIKKHRSYGEVHASVGG